MLPVHEAKAIASNIKASNGLQISLHANEFVDRYGKYTTGQEALAEPLAKLEISPGRGFRPIQLWVPDTRSPKFAAECRRQSDLFNEAHPTVTCALAVWIGLA